MVLIRVIGCHSVSPVMAGGFVPDIDVVKVGPITSYY